MVSERSRLRFADFRRRLREAKGTRHVSPGKGSPQTREDPRSVGRLLVEFWKLLGGYRWGIALSLTAATVATLLALIPPIATKLTIDNVLGDKPLEGAWTALVPQGLSRWQLLWWLSGSVMIISVVQTAIGLLSRWWCTRTMTRLQVSVRKQVFEHAVRLPLHRVYQIRSGGVASILREDAGGIGELVFSMIYNPWRAMVQLIGSLAVLAWVDWRLLTGGHSCSCPEVFYSHRTWIGRIRPLYRDIRKQRQDIDSHATEAFGGMRVVRAFGRQRSEAGRFTRASNLMARQEMLAWWWSRGVEIVWDILIPLVAGGTAALRRVASAGGQVVAGRADDVSGLPDDVAQSRWRVLAESATGFQSSLAGLDRVLDLLAEPAKCRPSRRDRGPSNGASDGQGDAAGVSFRYPGSSERVLSDINLDVRNQGKGWRWSGRAGRARRRYATSWPASTTRPPAASSSTASTCAGSTSKATAGCWGSSSRTCFSSTARWPIISPMRRAAATTGGDRAGGPDRQRPRVHCRAATAAMRR